MRACARFGVKIKRGFSLNSRGGVATSELLAGLEFLQLEHRSIFRSPFSQHGAFCYCRLFNSFLLFVPKKREKKLLFTKILANRIEAYRSLGWFYFSASNHTPHSEALQIQLTPVLIGQSQFLGSTPSTAQRPFKL